MRDVRRIFNLILASCHILQCFMLSFSLQHWNWFNNINQNRNMKGKCKILFTDSYKFFKYWNPQLSLYYLPSWCSYTTAQNFAEWYSQCIRVSVIAKKNTKKSDLNQQVQCTLGVVENFQKTGKLKIIFKSSIFLCKKPFQEHFWKCRLPLQICTFF